MRQTEAQTPDQECERLRAEVRELHEQVVSQDREYADLLVRFQAERLRNKALLFNNDRLRAELAQVTADAAKVAGRA